MPASDLGTSLVEVQLPFQLHDEGAILTSTKLDIGLLIEALSAYTSFPKSSQRIPGKPQYRDCGHTQFSNSRRDTRLVAQNLDIQKNLRRS